MTYEKAPEDKKKKGKKLRKKEEGGKGERGKVIYGTAPRKEEGKKKGVKEES